MAIDVVIITLNEAGHIRRCIESLSGLKAQVTVVDSGSTDETVAIAAACGARVLHHRFRSHAEQVNYGLSQLTSGNEWIFRLDADEVLLNPDALLSAVRLAGPDTDGLLVRRRIHFMGRPMRWGGMDPVWQLRLWRKGYGRCEQRWMDEHVIVDGKVEKSAVRVEDINLASLTQWTAKHNGYASREAVDILIARSERGRSSLARSGRRDQIVIKRALKDRVYLALPPGLRALLYFLYRYVFRLGFLDGAAGWCFHLLQALWYRSLVDAKIMEVERYASEHGLELGIAIKDRLGIDPTPASSPDGSTERPGD